MPPLKKELSLRYFCPPGAKAKLPSYIYHEPGERVRESLATLAEERARGRRDALQRRHRDEVKTAKMIWQRESAASDELPAA